MNLEQKKTKKKIIQTEFNDSLKHVETSFKIVIKSL